MSDHESAMVCMNRRCGLLLKQQARQGFVELTEWRWSRARSELIPWRSQYCSVECAIHAAIDDLSEALDGWVLEYGSHR